MSPEICYRVVKYSKSSSRLVKSTVHGASSDGPACCLPQCHPQVPHRHPCETHRYVYATCQTARRGTTDLLVIQPLPCTYLSFLDWTVDFVLLNSIKFLERSLRSALPGSDAYYVVSLNLRLGRSRVSGHVGDIYLWLLLLGRKRLDDVLLPGLNVRLHVLTLRNAVAI